jgi:hypothetical protein
VNSLEFLALFQAELGVGLASVITMCAIYAALLWKSVESPFDPLFLGGLAHAFAAAVVLFLWVENLIEPYYLTSYFLTELAFWGGLFVTSRPVRIARFSPGDLLGMSEFMKFYYCSIALLAISVAAFISRAGVLVVQDVSRLVVLQEMGWVSWLFDGTTMSVSVLVMMKRYAFNRRARLDWAVLALVLVALSTKGGKSDFIVMAFAAFLVGTSFSLTSVLRSLRVLYVLVPVALYATTAAVLSTWGSEMSVGEAMLGRLILFGDVFFQGYDSTAFNSLPQTNWIRYFFGSVVDLWDGVFGGVIRPRIVLGYELSSLYYGIDEGIGPNARHNILGLYLFGFYGAIAFSFLCGTAVSVARTHPLFGSRSAIAVALYLVLNIISVFVMIDPAMALGYGIKIAIVAGVAFTCTRVLGALTSRTEPGDPFLHSTGSSDA